MKSILSVSKLYLSLIIIASCYAIIVSHITYAVNLNHQFNTDKRIDQLYQISEAHSEYLIQIQKQISENQKNIDTLRDHIQNIQHHITNINNDQKISYKKLNEILNVYNKIYTINDNQSFIDTEKIETHNTIIKKDVVTKNTQDHIAYKYAVSLVLEKKKYDQAIQTFQDFIKNYPNSSYQSNAHYWLGQLYYNKNKKNEASYYFAIVTKDYPQSPKAPEALLKIGIILQETKNKDQAKMIYQQINKLYPNSSIAKQAKKQLAHL